MMSLLIEEGAYVDAKDEVECSFHKDNRFTVNWVFVEWKLAIA